ncbi:MAG: hypothetical protein PWP45_1279 [Tepidanaerobacteraceae bacterium]|nr:hypothetical protein [Tepidanaerobacteraceae bacterium]
MGSKTILLINHYAGAPELGMEYRPYYLAKEWIRLGHKVIIVASSYSHLRIKNADMDKYVKEEEIDGIKYVWLKTIRYKGNGLKRVLNMLNFILRLSQYNEYLVKKYHPNVVIASSTYPLDIFPAYLISKKSRAKLIFEVHDLWPLTPIELGGYSKYHPFIVIMQIAENFAYRKSDYVVSILPKAYEYMKEHGLASHKFVHIPNGICVEEWEGRNQEIPKEHKKLIERLKSEGKFIVGYTGAHGIANALDTLIESAQFLKGRPVAIVLVGDGPEKVKLKTKVDSMGLENIFFLPPVPKSSISKLLSMMDALYIGLKKQSLFRYGISPNKLIDYMMSGKPIIQSITAGNDIVKETGCGISVEAEDPSQVAYAIEKLMNLSEEERKIMGGKGRNYVKKYHSYQKLAEDFAKLF